MQKEKYEKSIESEKGLSDVFVLLTSWHLKRKLEAAMQKCE